MNLFKPDKTIEKTESLATLLASENVTIERILSPPFTTTEVSKQPHDEWVCVLQGSAKLEMDQREITLYRGDNLLIPAHTPHRVLTTSQQPHCIWLAIHIL
jgi:cupin 2 domain-containing protein